MEALDLIPVFIGLFGSSASVGNPRSAPFTFVYVTRPVMPFCWSSVKSGTSR